MSEGERERELVPGRKKKVPTNEGKGRVLNFFVLGPPPRVPKTDHGETLATACRHECQRPTRGRPWPQNAGTSAKDLGHRAGRHECQRPTTGRPWPHSKPARVPKTLATEQAGTSAKDRPRGDLGHSRPARVPAVSPSGTKAGHVDPQWRASPAPGHIAPHVWVTVGPRHEPLMNEDRAGA